MLRGGIIMKKLFLVLVVIGLTLSLSPLAVVQAADPKDSICTGLKVLL